MSGNSKRPDNVEIIQILDRAQGLVSHAAQALGVHRTTLNRWINEDPELQVARDSSREQMKDIAESKLFQAIQKGDMTAIIFYLKTQAKDRGYIEKSQSHLTVDFDAVVPPEIRQKLLNSDEGLELLNEVLEDEDNEEDQ